MAYVHGDKSLLRRAIAIGQEMLTTGKHDSLVYLREQWCRATNTLVQAVWQPEPLVQREPAVLEALLLAEQKAFIGLNKAYVEKARLCKDVWSRCRPRGVDHGGPSHRQPELSWADLQQDHQPWLQGPVHAPGKR